MTTPGIRRIAIAREVGTLAAVAHASLRAGEAASCRPCTEKVKRTQKVNPVGANEAGSFVTGPQGCGRYHVRSIQRAPPNPDPLANPQSQIRNGNGARQFLTRGDRSA